MEEKYLKKFAEIVEKLRTADDREAYRILQRMQYGEFLHKAAISLVKKDFSLNQPDAVSLLGQVFLPKGRDIDVRQGFSCSWYNSKAPDEKIVVGLDCSNMKRVKLLIGHGTGNILIFSPDAIFSAPPAKLKTIVDGLEGFAEKKPGLWVRPLGEVKNLAQAKRLIKPVWDEVFNAIAPFGESW